MSCNVKTIIVSGLCSAVCVATTSGVLLNYIILKGTFFFQDQLRIHVEPGALDVYTYYGAERIQNTAVLSQKDIVLTTYQTLSSEFSKV